MSSTEINWEEQEEDDSFSPRAKINSPAYRQAKVDSSLSNHRMETKMHAKFLKFMEKHAIQLYENVLVLCNRFAQTPILSISICSQIVLFKNQQLYQRQALVNKSQSSSDLSSPTALLNIEQHLSKSLIDSIDKNIVLLDNYIIVDILLELYIKCATFRYNLNECKNFHTYLLNCLNKSLESLAQKSQPSHLDLISNDSTKYLEIILHLVFVYFYYNKKASNLY